MAPRMDEQASVVIPSARPPKTLLLRLADGLLFLTYSVQVMICWNIGKEDAFICFRYVRNLLRGDGLVYNPGEYVEGISNPLWTLLLALLAWFRVPIDAADNLMVLFFAAAAFLVYRRVFLRLFGDRWAARMPLFLLVCATSVMAGFGFGLEGPAVALAGGILLSGAAAASPGTIALGAVLLLGLRPEGFAYAGWAFLWFLAVSWKDHSKRRDVVLWAAFTAGVFGALTGFRMYYYGDFIPNTVRAKSADLDMQVIASGARHVLDYLWTIGPILVLSAAVGALFRQWRGLWCFAAGLVCLNMAVVLRNGGDWMQYYRLMSPHYGLLVFMATISLATACTVGRRSAILAGLVCLAGGVWTVQAGPILQHAAELPGTCVNMWREPVDFNRLFDAHVSLADFHEKDDRVLTEWGGVAAYAMDGVAVTEMWGLTDREIAEGRGPGTHFVPGGGRICWPAALAKEPTYMLMWHWALPMRVSSMAEVPELREKVGRFLVVQDVPFDRSFHPLNLFFARSDRKILSKCLLHYGAIAPALDYDDSSRHGHAFEVGPVSEEQEIAARTRWQKGGWTAEDGAEVPTSWIAWDDDLRLSSVLLLHPGVNRFSRAMADDAPLAFLFGRFPALVPEIRVKVVAEEDSGGPTEMAAAEWSDGPSVDFVLNPLLAPSCKAAKPARVVVELKTETACGVFMAAHRWSPEPLPKVPDRFVADTRLGTLTGFQVPEMPDAAAAAERARAALADDSRNNPKRFLLGAALARGGDWTAGERFLREALSLDRNTWKAGVMVYLEEAERRCGKGDLRGAVEMLRMVRTLDPEYLGHALRLAEILTELGESGAALAQCREVLVKAPESPRTAALLDRICGQHGDAGGSAGEWRAIAEKQPKSVVPWQHLADALDQTGDHNGAAAARELAAANAKTPGS